MAVRCWAVRLERTLTQQEMETLLALLPRQRRERLLQMRKEEKRQEMLCAWALLRLALRQQYGWKDWPEIAYTSLGKPYFPENPEVHFSISHTHGAVLVALADQPVGADLEKIRPMKLQTMEQVAGVTEEEAFFSIWVRREARGKRSGEGIASMLRQEPPVLPEENYHALDLFPGYAAGIAADRFDSIKKVYKYTLDEMLELTFEPETV